MTARPIPYARRAVDQSRRKPASREHSFSARPSGGPDFARARRDFRVARRQIFQKVGFAKKLGGKTQKNFSQKFCEVWSRFRLAHLGAAGVRRVARPALLPPHSI